MRFTVTWLSVAESRLITLWMQAPDQQQFTEAANRIEKVLRDDPEGASTPLGKLNVYIDDPLAVLFHISPDDRIVRVIDVRRSRA